MTDSSQKTRFRFWLWLISLVGVIVPRRLRTDWRQEWQAELNHREMLLAEWDRLGITQKLALLGRSTSSFRDALWLQQLRWEDEMIQDLRYGVRMLLKKPGFTLIAVLTLALGIGANTSIFTLLDKTLNRSLPVERPQELVAFLADDGTRPGIFSYPVYTDLRERNKVLSDVLAYFQQPFSLSDENQTERVTGQIVSGNYFSVLGLRPALGRFFLPEEDRTPDTHPVVVIGHNLWRRHFNADPAVIGKTVIVNWSRYTVVGVTPPEFTGTTRGTTSEIYVPIMMQRLAQPGRNGKLDDRGSGWLRLIGRLNPNVSRDQAQAALDIVIENINKTFPGNSDPKKAFLINGGYGYTDRVKDLSLPLKLLMGAVGFVLLIACANVANLLLARASARRREIAVRLAIGATRWRIMRQLLTESTILALLGGSAGLMVAYWFTALLLGFQQQTNDVPRTLDGRFDGLVLGFTFGLSFLTGIVFGVVPAVQASKPDFVTALKQEVSGFGGGRRIFSSHNVLVVAQVALSMIVLIGAGLCVKSLYRLQAIDPGFQTAKVVTASFDLSLNGYNKTRGQQFFAQLSERVAHLPGVESVSFARGVALSDFVWTRSATIDGYTPQPNERLAFNFNVITPDHFKTLGIPLLSGREFTAQDIEGGPRVVIVNEATARRYWPEQDAIGKRLKYGNVDKFAEVIGVVRNSREKGLTEDPRPTIYTPVSQNYVPDLTLHVRAETDSQSLLVGVRREVHMLDPALPVYNLQTLADQKDGSLYSERLAATLLTLFGLLALLLAAIGLYGVLSYAVSIGMREMGIRLALGAQQRDLLSAVVRHGLTLTFIGLAIGIAASFLLMRSIEKLLFGVSATDPLTFVVVSLLMSAVAFVACWIPARRATRVDPMVALRYE